jgi:hypothetical protein
MPFDVGFDPLIDDQQQHDGCYRKEKFPVIEQRMGVRH